MIDYETQMDRVFCASDAVEDVLLVNDSVSKLRPCEFSHAPYTGTEHSVNFIFLNEENFALLECHQQAL